MNLTKNNIHPSGQTVVNDESLLLPPKFVLLFLEYSTIFVTRWEEDHSMYGKSVLELSLKCIFGDQKNFKNTSFFMM